MKKQQKRKNRNKKRKNRNAGRRRPTQQRSEQVERPRGSHDRVARQTLGEIAVEARKSTSYEGMAEAAYVLFEALRMASYRNVRASEEYRIAESSLADLIFVLVTTKYDAGVAEMLKDCVLSNVSQRLRLHASLVIFETGIREANREEVETLVADGHEFHRLLGVSTRSATVALNNFAAHRMFELGHSTEAEKFWRLVRQSLSDAGYLDPGADRLLRSNGAISRWRRGDLDGALSLVEPINRQIEASKETSPIAMYPEVQRIELLRQSELDQEADTAIEQLLERIPAAPAHDADDVRYQDLVKAELDTSEWDTRPALFRTYVPKQVRFTGRAGSSGLWEPKNSFYGAASGVEIVDWCTPEELVRVHGSADPLFQASVRLLSVAAYRESSPLALHQLNAARRCLQETEPNSSLIEDIRTAERAAVVADIRRR